MPRHRTMAEAAKIAGKTIPDDPITRYHVSTYERMNGWGQVFSVAGTVKCGCIYRSQEDANNNANDLSGDEAKEEKERKKEVIECVPTVCRVGTA
ncbi:hypothetical protein DTO021C3_7609 [Paecilomyces variotii]|nr:hypothetical protein DTO021C3_7609 [Paecilomyces variotii]